MAAEQDETRARATLAEMQAKLARGPHETLGITQVASFDDIRSAFLELTKVYHPARFARMATDLQRLSNEVFLGIKSAHDQLVKALGPSPRANRSSQMPPFRVTGSGPNQVVPDASAARPKVTQPAPIAPMPARPTPPQPARPASPSGTRPATPPNYRPTPAGGIPITRPTPVHGVPIQPINKTQPMPVVPRAKTGQTAAPPPTTTPARPTTPSQPLQRPTTPTNAATRPTGQMPAAQFDEKAELRQIMELIRLAKWGDAATALQGLAAKAPTKQTRAMLSYARAREAQVAGRIDDAVHELKRALEIDPALSPAKTALAELQTRRK